MLTTVVACDYLTTNLLLTLDWHLLYQLLPRNVGPVEKAVIRLAVVGCILVVFVERSLVMAHCLFGCPDCFLEWIAALVC